MRWSASIKQTCCCHHGVLGINLEFKGNNKEYLLYFVWYIISHNALHGKLFGLGERENKRRARYVITVLKYEELYIYM